MQKLIYLTLFFTSFAYIQIYAQEIKVQWASKVLGFSSQYITPDGDTLNPQYKAIQVLGKPNKLPAAGDSPCAWRPAQDDSPTEEWIKVGFDEPMKIMQVAIAENFNPGAVSAVYVYDRSDREELIYRNTNVIPIGQKSRIFSVFKKTDYEVAAVKIMLATNRISGSNQIDAIAISNGLEPIEAKINLADKGKLNIKAKPENLGRNINSEYVEVAPVIAPDGKTIYFTREHPENMGEIDPRTGNKKQDVWYAELLPDGSFDVAKNIGKPINTPEHNAVFSITADGTKMLLNNIYTDEGLKKGLSISTRRSDGSWSKPEPLNIKDYYNSNDNSEVCLSPDGKVLIMAVERLDGQGGKDLYVSFNEGGYNYSRPKSLGKVVNTAANEVSPFLAADGVTLYFATSGLSGYGETDIFVTRRLDDTWQNWSEPENLGPEINTPRGDGYFSIPASGDFAYFTSFANSIGSYDIFRVPLSDKTKPKPVVLLRGKVLNDKDKLPIEANLSFEIDIENKSIGTTQSDKAGGNYKIVLQPEKKYIITVEAKGFLPVVEDLDCTDIKEYKEIVKDFTLVPIEKGQTVRLNHVFFATSTANLLASSKPELDKMVKTMRENPNMVIRLEGHTNIFGKRKDQYKLGLERVKAVRNYFIDSGIEPQRIKIESYGADRPLTLDKNPQEQMKNQRVEIKILKN
ncbi:MAG: OmpA family protein [Microscillaceae bacterium]|nr:OmpA family protein [Microscillaceae bacterium]MDW8460983.1 OmpA family protein [Cytophagales bacterium]